MITRQTTAGIGGRQALSLAVHRASPDSRLRAFRKPWGAEEPQADGEESIASRTARALLLHLAPWLACAAPLPAIPGGVRLGATDIELLVDAGEAGLTSPDDLQNRAFLLMRDHGASDRLTADVQYVSGDGHCIRRSCLVPWIDPAGNALWFVCADHRPDRAVRLLPDGLLLATWPPAPCARIWWSGRDQAGRALADWRRDRTRPPLAWEQMLATGAI